MPTLHRSAVLELPPEAMEHAGMISGLVQSVLNSDCSDCMITVRTMIVRSPEFARDMRELTTVLAAMLDEAGIPAFAVPSEMRC